MNKVNTVLGEISPDEMGVTLVHEHIIYAYPGWYADTTMAPINREQLIRTGVATLEDVKACGVRTYVDATPNDSGRDPRLLAEVSKKTGINIICTTGFYTEVEGASAYFRVRRSYFDIVPEITEMFVKEITEGIGDTGIKAGVIKLASGFNAISDYEKAFFKAAAKAQQKTGVPIITHTEKGTMGPEQAEFLVASGADPKRVMIGHMSDNTDARYHLRTLEKGVSIGFDRMGLGGVLGIPADAERYPVLIGLIASGYASRIMISHDYVPTFLGRPWHLRTSFPSLVNYYPTHVFKNVIPLLKKAGITDAQIKTITVDNPRRLYGG